MEKSAKFVLDHSQFSDGAQEQKCVSKRLKSVRPVQRLKMFAKHVYLTWNMAC